jgi:lipopolysaccharide heptosyltransferase II
MKCTYIAKHIDRLIGRISVYLICKWPSRQFHAKYDPNSVKSFLLIRPGGIGDAVLLIPTINAIRRAYPACSIDILAEKRNAAVFQLVTVIRKVYLYDTLSGLPSVLRNRYDVVIDTEQWYRLSAVVARTINAPVKIGFASNDRERLFPHPVAYSLDAFEVDSFMNLLQPLAITIHHVVPSPFLHIPDLAADTAASLLEGVGGKPIIVMFPGSSVREKCWGTERFISLANRLTERGATIVIVGGQEEISTGEEIIREASGLNLAGKTSFVETAATIARADILVSGDSGLLHIAAGLDTPTVALFGPSSIAKWAPRGKRHRVVDKNISCSPCSRYGTIPPCPHNVRCMADITVDEVFQAVEHVMAECGGGKKKSGSQ